MKNAELLATQKILLALIQDKVSLKQSFTKDTKALTKEICFGVCRNFYFLNYLASQFVKKKPKDIKLWIVVLIGIYQLRFLNIPAYAIVKETVGILQSPWEKNFVNAVLRSYLRTQENKPTENISEEINTHLTDLEATYNHPIWFIKKVQNSWPKNWHDILIENNQHPPLTIRVNNKVISSNDYLKLLEKADIPAKSNPLVPSGIIITNPVQVNYLPGFKDGLVSVQDLAAQLAVKFLDLQPGQKVLDACAAPGGKTCHILESETNLSKCLAIDISKNRASRIHENLKRLNLHADVKICDGLETAKWWDGEYFDRILLDAPCSASGVIRRNPDIKLLRTEEEISLITKLQQQLLTKIWQTLKPGGKLVYTTCSILPEENENQISWFLSVQKDCKYLAINLDPAIPNKCELGLQILPGENNMDGFFYSVLIKDT